MTIKDRLSDRTEDPKPTTPAGLMSAERAGVAPEQGLDLILWTLAFSQLP